MGTTWNKKGLIYCPDGTGRLKSHAARPVPYRLDDGTLRLFFSSRDADDRMLPTYIDVDVRDPSCIKAMAPGPLMELGRPGTFDDSGITLGCLVDRGDEVLLYYTGWKRRRVVSFELAIGAASWDKKSERFTRLFEGPLLAQDRNHPLLVAGPFVMAEGGRFKMWYCSGTDWRFPAGNPEPLYTVFVADSADGLTWTPHVERGPAIPYAFDGEVISAPWVLPAQGGQGGYVMWYSRRGHATNLAKRYTIGFARSADGRSWERRDEEVGISCSDAGWDSEMICYPAFYRYEGRVYMFYSGNGVGRGGIGYAVSDVPSRA